MSKLENPNMENESIHIQKIETNDYMLTVDVNQIGELIDGHKWTLLIKSHSQKEAIDLKGVMHDSESDFYTATASCIEPLQKIKSIIQLLNSDKDLMNIALETIGNKYHDEDDMSTEQWLNLLLETGVDMNQFRKATFLFSAMQNKALANNFAKELNLKNYKTEIDLFDGDYIIEAQTSMKPILSEIHELEEKFRVMALDYGVVYITCGI